ncbi:MAG: heme lyase CcmF/NrfE family subunit [Gemmatimonadota bacterium]|nr:MAG: heme lyase CcmF/NrfE family subunit [Gemmatimonadota bacterium]
MIVLGELALWIALPVAIWGMVLAFVGGRHRRGDLVLSAERSIYAVFALLGIASAGIVAAFLGDRYEYLYVASYSNRALDTFYKASGLWAGQRGSLLFWAVLLAFFSAVAVFTNRRKNREFMPYVAGVLLTIITFFIVVLLFADVNPFEQLGFTPADGQGLNPQLQNYWMTIHPPTLYLGFTAFAVPFAFAMSALLSGRVDSRWIVVTRRWTLLSWFFLSNGIIFGMRWAYEELGWGGYWFWDPVENASLLPWLTATAFLHSVMIQEKRGMLKVWNMALVTLTFMLTIFATFLTRSGLIESVHSFAQETKIALIFLGFLALIVAVSVVLIIHRYPQLRSESEIQSFFSRESAFLFNNLILLAVAFAVIWGILLPLLSEGLTGEAIQVGAPFFNRVNLPMGMVLLALVGIGPVIAWRRASKRNLAKNFTIPLLVGVTVVGVFAIRGSRHWMSLITFGISAFVMTVILVEFFKGTRARSRIEGEGIPRAFVHLVARNRRRWGGYIVHVGIVMIFTAFAGNAFNVEVIQTLEPGQSITLASPLGHDYTLTYEGLSSSRGRNMVWQAVALMSLDRDGRRVGSITTEKRMYETSPSPMTEVGIHSTPFEDVYIILANAEDLIAGAYENDPSAQRATFEFQINLLVSWLWYGGLMLTFGSLIAIWPSQGPLPAEKQTAARPEAVPATVGAD